MCELLQYIALLNNKGAFSVIQYVKFFIYWKKNFIIFAKFHEIYLEFHKNFSKLIRNFATFFLIISSKFCSSQNFKISVSPPYLCNVHVAVTQWKGKILPEKNPMPRSGTLLVLTSQIVTLKWINITEKLKNFTNPFHWT